MDYRIRTIGPDEYPAGLLEIPNIPPTLSVLGAPLEKDAAYLAVVGSRAHTSYGADVCERLIRGLAGSDIIIVSGLALGIDSVAHRAAMAAGLKTVALPGSGLSERAIYPATNLSLAKEILASGGSLVSEFPNDAKARNYFFPKRNRLMAGIARAVLVIEAADRSGTLITAHLAMDYNRDVLAVPGPITSALSLGANLLIKQGATPVTRSEDILEVFGLKQAVLFDEHAEAVRSLSPEEREIYEMLTEPIPRDSVLAGSDLPAHTVNSLLTAMELKGLIKEEYGEVRRV